MSKKARNKWFVFCKDEASNEALSLALSAVKGFNPDFSHLLCADGEYRHLYEVPEHSFAKRFVKAKHQVEIFFSQNDGKPQRFNLLNKQKSTLEKLAKASKKNQSDTTKCNEL
ncbi:MAG: hypothetical protein WCT07_04230 [Candidatus Paceibacterota bacterium]|jgi:hypothetical protein